MPFTPLHFGPALAVRELVGHKRFGIYAFTATQVLFDLEPAIRMFFDLPGELHETTHNPTFGIIYALVAIVACWKWERWSSIVGAVFGSITHLWLDAMYHVDVAQRLLNIRPGETKVEIIGSVDAVLLCYLGFFFWALFAGIRYSARLRREKNNG